MEAGTFAPLALSWLDVLARVGAAIVLSLALGLERFLREKPIDFRPYVIISLAACTLVIGVAEYGVKVDDSALAVDPSRVVQGVLTGVGFVAAGALFQDEKTVFGAGTATSIWAAGGIGLICGFGQLWLAAILSVCLLLVLGLSRPFTGEYTVRIEEHKDEGKRDKEQGVAASRKDN